MATKFVFMDDKLRLTLPHAEQNYRLIHDIYVLLDAGDRRVLDQYGLSTAQFRILTLLSSEPGWRLTDLSQAMLCARSTITRIVDGLEASGLVQRMDVEEDRRAQRVRLTETGVELVCGAREAHGESLLKRLGEIESETQARLSSDLQDLRNHLLTILADGTE